MLLCVVSQMLAQPYMIGLCPMLSTFETIHVRGPRYLKQLLIFNRYTIATPYACAVCVPSTV